MPVNCRSPSRCRRGPCGLLDGRRDGLADPGADVEAPGRGGSFGFEVLEESPLALSIFNLTFDIENLILFVRIKLSLKSSSAGKLWKIRPQRLSTSRCSASRRISRR
jgi:hypothetical protein